MSDSNIVLTRIDNRLVHGQVGITWGHVLNIHSLVVVDDTTATSPFSQKLMQCVATAANLNIIFYTVDKFIDSYDELAKYKKIFLIIPSFQIARKILEGGIELSRINVGNIHYERERVAFNHKVYLSKEDIDDINYILSKEVQLFYQDVPGTTVEKFTELNYELMKRKR